MIYFAGNLLNSTEIITFFSSSFRIMKFRDYKESFKNV